LMSTVANRVSTLTLPKSIPPSANACWPRFLSLGLSLLLPSPIVQPDGQARSRLPSALGHIGPTLPALDFSLGRSRLNAKRTLPLIGRPSASRIGRLADGRSSPVRSTLLPSLDSATVPLMWPGPILASSL